MTNGISEKAFVMTFLSLPTLQSLSRTPEEHYYPIPPEEQLSPTGDEIDRDLSLAILEKMENLPAEDFAIFPYASFLTTTTPTLLQKNAMLSEDYNKNWPDVNRMWSDNNNKWMDNNFSIFPYSSFLTTSSPNQPKRKVSIDRDTTRYSAGLKPANVVHFLEKILKLKRQSERNKQANTRKGRPSQAKIVHADLIKKGKDRNVKKKVSFVGKQDFTKADALQKLLDIAGDDWDQNKEHIAAERFRCPLVLDMQKNILPMLSQTHIQRYTLARIFDFIFKRCLGGGW